MDTSQDREQWTHEEVVAGARQSLLSELAIDGSALAEAYLKSPIGPRVRVGGVRAGLARIAAEQVAAAGHDVRYGGFIDPSDEVVLHLPAHIELPAGLPLPVLSSVSLKLIPFVTDLAQRGPGAVAQDLLTRQSTSAREVERQLRARPPTYEGWTKLGAADIDRAFRPNPPLLNPSRTRSP